jgi:hypothetical protein
MKLAKIITFLAIKINEPENNIAVLPVALPPFPLHPATLHIY